MIEIYRNRDSAKVGQFQSLLEAEGIPTFFRNEFLSANMVPVPAASPALCVVNEGDVERGIGLIRQYEEATETEEGSDVICAKCGETVPGAFAVCWSCDEPVRS